MLPRFCLNVAEWAPHDRKYDWHQGNSTGHAPVASSEIKVAALALAEPSEACARVYLGGRTAGAAAKRVDTTRLAYIPVIAIINPYPTLEGPNLQLNDLIASVCDWRGVPKSASLCVLAIWICPQLTAQDERIRTMHAY